MRRHESGGHRPSHPQRSEIAKAIDAYVKAHQTAELDERVAQLSHAEPMKIAMSGHGETVSPVGGVLTLQSFDSQMPTVSKNQTNAQRLS